MAQRVRGKKNIASTDCVPAISRNTDITSKRCKPAGKQEHVSVSKSARRATNWQLERERTDLHEATRGRVGREHVHETSNCNIQTMKFRDEHTAASVGATERQLTEEEKDAARREDRVRGDVAAPIAACEERQRGTERSVKTPSTTNSHLDI